MDLVSVVWYISADVGYVGAVHFSPISVTYSNVQYSSSAILYSTINAYVKVQLRVKGVRFQIPKLVLKL